MTDVPRTSVARLERLIEEGFRLEEILARNALDLALRRRGWEITYFIDSPVFSLYAEPVRNSEMVAAIPSLSEFSDAEPEERGSGAGAPGRATLNANALLTGEYIFRPDSLGPGPVYVAPEHAPEVYAYCSALERRSSKAFSAGRDDSAKLFGTIRHRLQAEQALFDGGGVSREDWSARIRRIVVAALDDATTSLALAPYRLTRLFDGSGVASGKELFLAEGVDLLPDEGTVSPWRDAIVLEKAGNRKKPSEEAIEADAITLAQLEQLNLKIGSLQRLCVLITPDRGLHRAARRRLRDPRNPSPTPFALRDPRQFSPILNIRDMKGAYTDKHIFPKLRDAISEFVAAFSSTRMGLASLAGREATAEGRPRRIYAPRLLPSSPARLEPFAAEIDRQVSELRALWGEALEYAIVAKADVIAEVTSMEVGLWSRVASEMQANRFFPRQMDLVQREFERIATSSTLLLQELRAIEEGLGGSVASREFNRRAVISTFRDFRSLDFSGKTLTEIALDLEGRRHAAIPILQGADRAERLLFAGALCLGIGAWPAARSLLGSAASLSSASSGLKTEIAFFRAVARRLAAVEHDVRTEYIKARNSLEQLLAASRSGDTHNAVRIQNELFALSLCETIFATYAGADPAEALVSAARHWQEITAAHGALFMSDAIDGPFLPLARQYALNSCSLLYWLHVTGVQAEGTGALRSVVKQVLPLATDGRFAHASCDMHATIYPAVVRYVLSGTGDREVTAAGARAAVEAALDSDRGDGFGFDMPRVDRLELLSMRACLALPSF